MMLLLLTMASLAGTPSLREAHDTLLCGECASVLWDSPFDPCDRATEACRRYVHEGGLQEALHEALLATAGKVRGVADRPREQRAVVALAEAFLAARRQAGITPHPSQLDALQRQTSSPELDHARRLLAALLPDALDPQPRERVP